MKIYIWGIVVAAKPCWKIAWVGIVARIRNWWCGPAFSSKCKRCLLWLWLYPAWTKSPPIRWRSWKTWEAHHEVQQLQEEHCWCEEFDVTRGICPYAHKNIVFLGVVKNIASRTAKNIEQHLFRIKAVQSSTVMHVQILYKNLQLSLRGKNCWLHKASGCAV